MTFYNSLVIVEATFKKLNKLIRSTSMSRNYEYNVSAFNSEQKPLAFTNGAYSRMRLPLGFHPN